MKNKRCLFKVTVEPANEEEYFEFLKAWKKLIEMPGVDISSHYLYPSLYTK